MVRLTPGRTVPTRPSQTLTVAAFSGTTGTSVRGTVGGQTFTQKVVGTTSSGGTIIERGGQAFPVTKKGDVQTTQKIIAPKKEAPILSPKISLAQDSPAVLAIDKLNREKGLINIGLDQSFGIQVSPETQRQIREDTFETTGTKPFVQGVKLPEDVMKTVDLGKGLPKDLNLSNIIIKDDPKKISTRKIDTTSKVEVDKTPTKDPIKPFRTLDATISVDTLKTPEPIKPFRTPRGTISAAKDNIFKIPVTTGTTAQIQQFFDLKQPTKTPTKLDIKLVPETTKQIQQTFSQRPDFGTITKPTTKQLKDTTKTIDAISKKQERIRKEAGFTTTFDKTPELNIDFNKTIFKETGTNLPSFKEQQKILRRVEGDIAFTQGDLGRSTRIVAGQGIAEGAKGFVTEIKQNPIKTAALIGGVALFPTTALVAGGALAAVQLSKRTRLPSPFEISKSATEIGLFGLGAGLARGALKYTFDPKVMSKMLRFKTGVLKGPKRRITKGMLRKGQRIQFQKQKFTETGKPAFDLPRTIFKEGKQILVKELRPKQRVKLFKELKYTESGEPVVRLTRARTKLSKRFRQTQVGKEISKPKVPEVYKRVDKAVAIGEKGQVFELSKTPSKPFVPPKPRITKSQRRVIAQNKAVAEGFKKRGKFVAQNAEIEALLKPKFFREDPINKFLGVRQSAQEARIAKRFSRAEIARMLPKPPKPKETPSQILERSIGRRGRIPDLGSSLTEQGKKFKGGRLSGVQLEKIKGTDTFGNIKGVPSIEGKLQRGFRPGTIKKFFIPAKEKAIKIKKGKIKGEIDLLKKRKGKIKDLLKEEVDIKRGIKIDSAVNTAIASVLLSKTFITQRDKTKTDQRNKQQPRIAITPTVKIDQVIAQDIISEQKIITDSILDTPPPPPPPGIGGGIDFGGGGGSSDIFRPRRPDPGRPPRPTPDLFKGGSRPRPKIPIDLPDILFKKPKKKKRIKKRKGKVSFKFQPSLRAVDQMLKGKSPNVLTGLEIRRIKI